MKRLLILLVALGLLVAFAAPAGAAKPDKPGKPGPELVEVTLTGDLDTTLLCPGPYPREQLEPIVMEMDNQGVLHAGEGLEIDGLESVPRIWIYADPLMWSRELPYYPPLREGLFDECHGGSVGGSMDWDGALWIRPDGYNGTWCGDSVGITWHFDHYWDRVPKKKGNGTENLIENFTLTGEASDSNDDGIYEGDFTISLHGGEPFEPGIVTMRFGCVIAEY